MSLANLDRRVHIAIAAFIAVGFFVLLSLAFIATPGLDQEPFGGAEDFTRLADGIFDTHVIALEALGILLTAALIGAMVIARPLGSTPDTINYATKRHGSELTSLQHASDVDRNLGSDAFPAPIAYKPDPTEMEEEE